MLCDEAKEEAFHLLLKVSPQMRKNFECFWIFLKLRALSHDPPFGSHFGRKSRHPSGNRGYQYHVRIWEELLSGWSFLKGMHFFDLGLRSNMLKLYSPGKKGLPNVPKLQIRHDTKNCVHMCRKGSHKLPQHKLLHTVVIMIKRTNQERLQPERAEDRWRTRIIPGTWVRQSYPEVPLLCFFPIPTLKKR